MKQDENVHLKFSKRNRNDFARLTGGGFRDHCSLFFLAHEFFAQRSAYTFRKARELKQGFDLAAR